ncbi:MAG: hypothetical protein ACPIOQ_84885, partial [Promethearchaeia archaeon]
MGRLLRLVSPAPLLSSIVVEPPPPRKRSGSRLVPRPNEKAGGRTRARTLPARRRGDALAAVHWP